MVEQSRASLPLKMSLAWLLISSLCLLFAKQSQAQEAASAPTPKTPPTAAPVEAPPKPSVINPNDYAHLCGRVYLAKNEELELKDMEKRLVCGDSADGQIGKPWTKIPGNQAKFFLSSFLQSRAHHNPQMDIIGGDLYVKLGSKIRATAFTLRGVPAHWEVPNRRYVRGRLLDPGLLDELEKWGEHQLKMNGYACGEASALANPQTGEIEVSLTPNDRLRINGTVDEKSTGLRGGVMERYNAYLVGDFYNQRLVDLTERRIAEEGIVSTIDLKPRCEEDGVTIVRRIDAGPSRQLRVGIGGSTDEGPRIRLNMRQTRIGDEASTAQANVDLSFRRQIANASFRWYYSSTLTGLFLEPVAEFRNRTQENRKEQIFEASLLHGWFYNFRSLSLTARAGPNYSENFLIEGFGPRRTTLTLLSTDAMVMDHDWEYFKNSPREGYNHNLDFMFAQEGVGSPFTAHRARYTGQQLFNLGYFDPPAMILGVRWGAGSTFAVNGLQAQLPTRYQFFGGGTGSLRGWKSARLPRIGASFSELRIGTELRYYKLLFNMVDPFIFADIAQMGDLNFKLLKTTFFSPGFGLRWESPVGSIRAFVAQPYVWSLPSGEPEYDKALRPGLTLGEEF